MTWHDILKEKRRLDMMGYNHSDSLLKLRKEIFESANENLSEAVRYFQQGIEGFKGAQKATLIAVELHDEIKDSVQKMIDDADKAIHEILKEEFDLYSSDAEGEGREEAEAERRIAQRRERSADFASRDD